MYHSICVTAGARWNGTTTTCSPFESVKLSASNCFADAGVAAARTRPMRSGTSTRTGETGTTQKMLKMDVLFFRSIVGAGCWVAA